MGVLPRLRIGRWPRRLAALSCLALAALAAIRPSDGQSRAGHTGPTLTAGQRAVPVSVVGDPHDYLAAGDAVELLTAAPADPSAFGDPPAGATATVVAGRATVLSIPAATSPVGDTGWPLIVAVDETTARRLAALAGRSVLAVAAAPP